MRELMLTVNTKLSNKFRFINKNYRIKQVGDPKSIRTGIIWIYSKKGYTIKQLRNTWKSAILLRKRNATTTTKLKKSKILDNALECKI